MKRFLLLLLLPQLLHAQTGLLSLSSEPPGAEVYLDSVFLGRTPLEHREVPEGLHDIRIFFPSARDWNAVVRAETVRITEGDTVQKTVELGHSISLISVPSGAAVIQGGTEIGTTPLFTRTSRSVREALILRKEGFEPKTIDPSMSPGTVLLRPVSGIDARAPEVQFEAGPDGQLRQWATVSSAAAMIVSGVFAAYYKHRANNRFDTYLSTNDPAALVSTERNDRRSAAALVITQISFGLLTYLLLTE